MSTQTPHQGVDGKYHEEPHARRAAPRAQSDPSGLDGLLPTRRKQAQLHLPRSLPVATAGWLAAQEAPAVNLEADQTPVLVTRMDQQRRHEDLLAQQGGGHAIQAAPTPPALDDLGNHRPTSRPERRCNLNTHQCGQPMSCGEPDARERARPVRRAGTNKPSRASETRRLVSDPTGITTSGTLDVAADGTGLSSRAGTALLGLTAQRLGADEWASWRTGGHPRASLGA
jgi:hypothetical protein